MADSRATAALAAEKPISRLGSGRDCHHLGGIHRTERFGLLPLFRQPKFKLSHHRLILRQQLLTHRANQRPANSGRSVSREIVIM